MQNVLYDEETLTQRKIAEDNKLCQSRLLLLSLRPPQHDKTFISACRSVDSVQVLICLGSKIPIVLVISHRSVAVAAAHTRALS